MMVIQDHHARGNHWLGIGKANPHHRLPVSPRTEQGYAWIKWTTPSFRRKSVLLDGEPRSPSRVLLKEGRLEETKESVAACASLKINSNANDDESSVAATHFPKEANLFHQARQR